MRIVRCLKDPWSGHCDDCPRIEEAMIILAAGSLVVLPTDTVYGIGAKALDPEVIEKVKAVKARPSTEPFPIAVGGPEDMAKLAKVPSELLGPIGTFQDEPVTFVFEAKDHVPRSLIGNGDTLGVRMISKGCVGRLVKSLGAIIATSANIHGDPPPTTVEGAVSSLGERVPFYIDGGPCPDGRPTTVVKVDIDPDGAATNMRMETIRKGRVSETLIKDRLFGNKT